MFRPCIDLHEGKVKQIVGGTLSSNPNELKTNFISERPPEWYAKLYRKDHLQGGHIIKLGPGNDNAALQALSAYPGGLQIGGGITPDNAAQWLDAGASHVIVTSYVFYNGILDYSRLSSLIRITGNKRLVLDLSCRQRHGRYYVVTDRWQKFTTLEITPQTLETLAKYCDEFLIHAADVEGLCLGIDFNLVHLLSESSPIPTTYAGGANSLADLKEVTRISQGKLDLTIGSALDIFGGSGVKYTELIQFNHSQLKKLQK